MFKGTYTALVTPFKNGEVDLDAFSALVERQAQAGIEGIVPIGTTGESPTLSQEERILIIKTAVKAAKGRMKVIAGTGANNTRSSVAMTKQAEDLGVDGALLVCPYYNKPPQEGLYQHFMEIAGNVDIPLVLYSIPGRSVIEISIETTARLMRDASNIVCMKEAGGKSDRVSKLKQAIPQHCTVLSGDDGLTVPFMSVGASGVISVVSNLVPAEVKKMVDAALGGDFAKARQMHEKLYGLFCDLFLESNPIPIKAACAEMGWMRDELRLPLVSMSEGNRKKLFETMRKAGVLGGGVLA